MCFSILPVPRCRIHVLASSWFESFHSLSRARGSSPQVRVLGSSTHELEGGYSRRSTGKTITTKTVGVNKDTLNSKTSNLRQEISDVSIKSSTNIGIKKSKVSEFQSIQYPDTQQNIGESRDSVGLTTFIVFDIETTGFSRENERIIEIAMQDLLGGKNSTFQTLVNPERYVPNHHVHGISTYMVSKPNIPRMKELIPILLQYIKSRQKPGGHVILVAHNARTFDVPFLVNEFSRCNFEIPPDWLFVDTLPLAREAMKSGGSKVSSKVSLQALREYYEVPLIGSAHRAMSDVNTLSLILQRLTFDLKLPVSGLVERSFTASDLSSAKKKKSSG
ncbi:hypothetical protein RHGRI_031919 [Rhododendron griersonianum]|uniref:Exonuclease domain-containing protein n=1 Tax=Rhododendron griersonianum TaxID=479676 RepID=A0AAV6IFH3_9ERIC|nr:hypothetical protein RHGRI_031919 [Rhododendron griersonianum]